MNANQLQALANQHGYTKQRDVVTQILQMQTKHQNLKPVAKTYTKIIKNLYSTFKKFEYS